VLDPTEVTRLLAACETLREEVVVRLAAESGLRNGEVRGLRWPDLDLDLAARRVTVRRAVWRDVVKQPKGKRLVPARVAYHELRHTAATTMLTNGTSAVVVARQLGHKDSRITTRVYEHLLDDGLLDAALSVFQPPDVAGRVAGLDEAEQEKAADRLR